MRTIVTGASGFVGSNIAKVLKERHGDTVIGDRVDMTDRAAVHAHVEATQPEAIVHCAILNDWARMHAERELAWAAYVESTRSYADAAAERGIPFCLVSTDWVFDGTQTGATESTPPNPINLYGFLKAASEIVALDRGGTVAARLRRERHALGATHDTTRPGPRIRIFRRLDRRRPRPR